MKRITTILVMAVIVCSGIGFAGALKIEDVSESDREILLKIRDEKVRQRILEAMGKLRDRYKDKRKASQERGLRREIITRFVTWAQSEKVADGRVCDKSIDSLIEFGPSDMRSHFLAAYFAFLRGNSDTAISILEKVITTSPDTKAPMANLPVRTVGRLWIGTIERYAGDVAKAIGTYDTLRADLDPNSMGDNVVSAICSLYLSELAADDGNNEARRIKELEQIGAIKKTPSASYDPIFVYRQWASYMLVRQTEGRQKASTRLLQQDASVPPVPFVAIGHLKVCGLWPTEDIAADQNRIIHKRLVAHTLKGSPGSFDEQFFQLALGYCDFAEGNYKAADTHHAAVFDDENFFSPFAGVLLTESKNKQGKYAEADAVLEKIKTRYPGYADIVEKIKNKWKKQREKK